jgi:hypothetical protein
VLRAINNYDSRLHLVLVARLIPADDEKVAAGERANGEKLDFRFSAAMTDGFHEYIILCHTF